ncbi:MAG: hypothetical protein JW913_20905 [Chitinispirillaceae bacterium]|nr:hypothetical protein [Chitinispirillaceae bacterium]
MNSANKGAPAANGQISGTNFFSSGLRRKVDQLMNVLWAGGVNNPMDSIEQISYLLFLRLLTEKDDALAAIDKKYTRIFSGKWSRFAWGIRRTANFAAGCCKIGQRFNNG